MEIEIENKEIAYIIIGLFLGFFTFFLIWYMVFGTFDVIGYIFP